MRRSIAAFAVLALVAAAVATGSAHHSFAVFFDDTKNVEITGSVTDFKFSNPHAIISLDVKNKAGVVEPWKAEGNAVTLLRRRGWTKDSLKPGDVVTIEGWPSRDGASYMRLRKVTRADGTVLGAAVVNPRAD